MDYIVYLTINLKNFKKYIGVHKTHDANVFDGYLGCGVERNAPSTYKRSKTPFQYAVNKYGVDSFYRITLSVFDNEDDAYYLEEILVDKTWITRPDTYNVSLGGKGGSSKLIKCFQYDFEGNFLKEYDSYAKAAELNGCSQNAIGRAIMYKRSSMGSLWTNVKITKLNIEEFHIDNSTRLIYEYNSDCEFIRTYDSVNDVIDELGVTRPSINRAIQGKYSINGKYYTDVYVEKFEKTQGIKIKNCPLYIYTVTGEFYKEFATPLECAHFFGDKTSSGISSAMRLGRLYKGYQISLEKLPCMKNYDKINVIKKKPIDQFDLQGNYIKTWDSTTEAIKVYGTGVKQVALGRQKQCHNYIFKYKES